jgi:hypothetical protein
MPVARKVWQHASSGRPVVLARRLIIRRASMRCVGRAVGFGGRRGSGIGQFSSRELAQHDDLAIVAGGDEQDFELRGNSMDRTHFRGAKGDYGLWSLSCACVRPRARWGARVAFL